jgi:hypothetical protein
MPEPVGQPEVTLENLENLTNQSEAPDQFPATPEPASTTEELPPSLSEQPAAQRGQAAEPQVPDFLKETPFKSPDELAKGYKNLQSEFTKTSQRIKPYEQFLERIEKDRAFANFVDQAKLLYDNPQLAQAYQPPQAAGEGGRPNPNAYDLSTAEGFAKYNQDFENYVLRNADSRVNARLSQIESQNRMEQEKWQFKQKFPDVQVDPEEAFRWAQQNVPNFNRYEVAYKLREFDNLKSKIAEEARKELNEQVKTAQTTRTPAASAPSHTVAKADDIIDYIARYGSDKAMAKFGKADVLKTIQDFS